MWGWKMHEAGVVLVELSNSIHEYGSRRTTAFRYAEQLLRFIREGEN